MCGLQLISEISEKCITEENYVTLGTSSDQISALLDTVQSDNEEGLDQLTNDFDMECLAAKDLHFNIQN